LRNLGGTKQQGAADVKNGFGKKNNKRPVTFYLSVDYEGRQGKTSAVSSLGVGGGEKKGKRMHCKKQKIGTVGKNADKNNFEQGNRGM